MFGPLWVISCFLPWLMCLVIPASSPSASLSFPLVCMCPFKAQFSLFFCLSPCCSPSAPRAPPGFSTTCPSEWRHQSAGLEETSAVHQPAWCRVSFTYAFPTNDSDNFKYSHDRDPATIEGSLLQCLDTYRFMGITTRNWTPSEHAFHFLPKVLCLCDMTFSL